jgi:uncharacterized tellurite resistance protein B-like protein
MDIITKNKINILIQLAEADKHFASSERDMIFKIAKQHHFDEAEVNDLIHTPEPILSLGALSREQKLEYLFACIDLIFVDQKVMESEITFAKNIAIKLGFNKNAIDFLVQNFDKKTPQELKKAVYDGFWLV